MEIDSLNDIITLSGFFYQHFIPKGAEWKSALNKTTYVKDPLLHAVHDRFFYECSSIKRDHLQMTLQNDP